LEFFGDDETPWFKVKTTAPPGKYRYLIFTGNITHNAADLLNGRRYAISFQLPRVNF